MALFFDYLQRNIEYYFSIFDEFEDQVFIYEEK